MIAEIKHLWNNYKNYVPYLFFGILLSLILSILVLISIDSSILPRTVLNLFVLIVFVLIVAYILSRIIDKIIGDMGKSHINNVALCKNIRNYTSEGDEFSAVLIGNNLSRKENNLTNACGVVGLHFLIKYFKNANKNYIICQEVDKLIFDRFVLKEDKCQELYLLGHGSKGSFRISSRTNQNEGEIDYSKYKGENEKRIIAQLHCANTVIGGKNESLVDILATDEVNSYVGHGFIPCLNIWLYCFNMWIKSISSPPTSTLKRHLFYIIKCIQK